MSKHLIVWDLDDTLYFSEVPIDIYDSKGKLVEQIWSRELADHKLQQGHRYCFSGLRNAQAFVDTRLVCRPAMNLFKRHQMLAKQFENYQIAIVTGRKPFDEPAKILNAFKEDGIDLDVVDFVCVGPINRSESDKIAHYKMKEVAGRFELDSEIDEFSMYDDDKRNLEAAVELLKKEPQIKPWLYLADHGNFTCFN